MNPWLQRWQVRCALEGGDAAQRAARMRQVNPWIIPRNHRVEEALAAASTQGDLQPFKACWRRCDGPTTKTARWRVMRSRRPPK